ncbi:hypothetical protein [Sphingopyxis sp.]|uniref:hypothetical protein n=1 Tax=Sphingopyxis sp. TaxID=1908224 RepID=UPI002ED9890A
MRSTLLSLTALLIVSTPAAAKKQPAEPPAPAAQPAKPGPKVHVSEAVDTSECMSVASKKSGLGGLVGGIVGLVAGDATVAMAGAAAGSIAADKIDRKSGCAPKAAIAGDEGAMKKGGKK